MVEDIAMMTRKDFVAIAEIIRAVGGDGFTGEDYDRGWRDALMTLAANLPDYFAKQNPKFDRERFLKACGGL
jgi:hypothetical protein